MSYTVGIKRFLRSPFYKKYKVVSHEVRGDKLILMCASGDQYQVPMLDKRIVRFYPDYHVGAQPLPPPVQAPSV